MTGRDCYQFCDVEVNGERYCGQMCDRSGYHRNHVCSDHLKVPRREVVAGANRTRPSEPDDDPRDTPAWTPLGWQNA